jgi:undecaprenyl-diphosphatase
MTLLQAIVLGLIQGLTEFLPISSSGHVLLVPALFGWEDAGSGFSAVIQLGSLVAVFIYFRRDIANMCKAWARSLVDVDARKEPDAKLAWSVLIGTIPVVMIGLALEEQIDTVLRSPFVAAGALIILGGLLWVADRSAKQERKVKDITLKDGLVIGLWQCLALIPGSSRSGSTITGALFSGFERSAAARYSFLLSIPAIGGSGLYKLYKESDSILSQDLMPTIVATLAAFVSGYWAIAFLIKFLQTHTTLVFVVYRVALGLIIIGLIFAGVVEASAAEVAQ